MPFAGLLVAEKDKRIAKAGSKWTSSRQRRTYKKAFIQTGKKWWTEVRGSLQLRRASIDQCTKFRFSLICPPVRYLLGLPPQTRLLRPQPLKNPPQIFFRIYQKQFRFKPCPVTLMIVSCLHLGQYRGKFSSTVSGRTLIRVLLLQIGHSTHFSFSNMPPPVLSTKSYKNIL